MISNKETNYTMKIVNSLEESDLMIKGVSKTIKKEAKKGGFLSMLLCTLGASLIGNLLTIRAFKTQLELVRIYNADSSYN